MTSESRPSAFLSALQEEGTKEQIFNYLVDYYWKLDAAEAKIRNYELYRKDMTESQKVPRESTKYMANTARRIHELGGTIIYEDIWRAMYDAAKREARSAS